MSSARFLRVALSTFVAYALMALPAVALAQTAPAYGRIVTQGVDAKLGVTETHLANGLTILSKESHAAPVAYFGVFYKVGSRNEISGQTGLSHILEHMMFKGTNDLPPGAVSRLFQRNGMEFNAETGSDYTYYHELLASDRLELSIRIEADRMRNSAFDPTQLSHEMTVVRSELEGDANDPGWQLYNYGLLPTAYTANSYHWPVIGWIPDVEAVANRRSVIYNYYQSHYMPNNAVVVMVGDFDTKKAIALCQRYFGVYGPGHLETHFITPEPTQHGERRYTLQRPGTVGEVLIGYHAPALGTQDHIVCDVIDQILSGGRSARLYQALVETGLADEAGAGNADQKDPNLFTLDGNVRSGVPNDAVEKALLGEVIKLQTTPVTSDEVTRAVNQISASFIYQNDSVSEQAEQLGQYAAIYDYKYVETYLDRIRAVTPADIQRVAQTYLTAENCTVATFEPQPLPPGQSPPPPAMTDNFGAAASSATPVQKDTLAALDKQFNTGKSPSLGKKTPPVRTVLPNGMVVIVQENHSNQTVALTGLVRAGSMYDPDGKYGLADLTAEMLQRGTKTDSALQLALALESVGAGVQIHGTTEDASFGGQSLTKDFGTTLSVLADELRNPAFAPAELDKLKSQTLSGIEQARQDAGGTGGAGAAASIAFAQALYPKGHPYWEPSLDDAAQSVKSITTSDLQTFHDTYYRPDTTVLVIVGDVTASDAVASVQKAFGDWAKPDAPKPAFSIPDVPLPAAAPAPKLVVIPDTSQTSLLFGFPGQLKRNDKDFYAVTVANFILGGGALSSKLGLQLRDTDGLCYTVYSDFDASHGAGPYTAFVGTNPKNAIRAVSELKRVMNNYRRTGATPSEVNEAVDYLTGSYPVRLETNGGVAGQLLAAEDFGLGLDYIQKRSVLYRSVTVGDVNRAIKKYLHPESAALVIGGAAPAQ